MQGRSKRILVVDDEPHVAAVLVSGLKSLGKEYAFDTACSGEEALEMIHNASEPYELVITDYRMPGISGIDLVQAIRNVSPETLVVLMTAYGTDALRNTTAGLSIDGYIDKPFTMAQIRRIVKDVLARTSQAARHPPPSTIGNDAYEHVRTLRVNTGARCVILLSSDGYPIETEGATEGLDLTSLGALVAANFMAAAEVARLLGSGSVFKSSYHEGPDYNVYSYDINGELLLAVIFGAESKPGVVWFYTKQVAAELAKLPSGRRVGSGVADELAAGLDAGLDELFGLSEDGAPATDDQALERSAEAGAQSDVLLSFEEAVAKGLIPGDLET